MQRVFLYMAEKSEYNLGKYHRPAARQNPAAEQKTLWAGRSLGRGDRQKEEFLCIGSLFLSAQRL